MFFHILQAQLGVHSPAPLSSYFVVVSHPIFGKITCKKMDKKRFFAAHSATVIGQRPTTHQSTRLDEADKKQYYDHIRIWNFLMKFYFFSYLSFFHRALRYVGPTASIDTPFDAPRQAL